MRDKPTTIPEFIEYLARASAAFGQQAGVGAMETAGSAISYLARHPKDLEPFLNGGMYERTIDALHKASRLLEPNPNRASQTTQGERS